MSGFELEMIKLKPPKNIRSTNHRRCENCAHLKSVDDFMTCERFKDDGPWSDETEIYTTVCDGHKKLKRECVGG